MSEYAVGFNWLTDRKKPILRHCVHPYYERNAGSMRVRRALDRVGSGVDLNEVKILQRGRYLESPLSHLSTRVDLDTLDDIAVRSNTAHCVPRNRKLAAQYQLAGFTDKEFTRKIEKYYRSYS